MGQAKFYSDKQWTDGVDVPDENLVEIRRSQGCCDIRDVEIDAMARELQRRRAADLTAEDVEALATLLGGLHQHYSWCSSDGTEQPCDCGAPAGITVLARLTRAGRKA